VIIAEWAFIFKFAEGEIMKAGSVRGVDPFAPNPWCEHMFEERICAPFSIHVFYFGKGLHSKVSSILPRQAQDYYAFPINP